MNKTGTIVRIFTDREFGFIKPDDGTKDVHFNTKDYPEGVKGMRVEFQAIETTAGKPHATSMKSSGSTVVSAPAPSASPPTELGVEIEIGTVRTIEEEEKIGDTDEVRKVPMLLLPVLVSLTRGSDKARDVEVLMEPNGVHRTRNNWDAFYSNQSGEAYFQVLVPPDAEETILTVRVATKNYSMLWQKVPKAETLTPTVIPEPTPVPKPTEPPSVQKLVEKPGGIYLYLVQTTPSTEVTSVGITVLMRQVPCAEDALWGKEPFTSDDKGSLQLEAKVEKIGDRGSLFFCAGGFQSKPQYLAHPSPPTK